MLKFKKKIRRQKVNEGRKLNFAQYSKFFFRFAKCLVYEMSKKKCIELVSVLAHRHYGSYCILRDIKDFRSYFRFWRNSSSLKDLKYREFWHRKSCVFFLWWMKLHVCLYQETEWHLESKNSLVRSVYDVTEYKVCSFAVNSNTQPSQLCCYLRTAASPAFIYYYDLR